MDSSDVAATSRISYVECLAAFARARREGRISTRDESSALRRFEERWPDLAVVELDDGLSRRAGAVARRRALRAGDSIHLASAAMFAEISSEATRFACWDRRLRRAAEAAGFATLPTES